MDPMESIGRLSNPSNCSRHFRFHVMTKLPVSQCTRLFFRFSCTIRFHRTPGCVHRNLFDSIRHDWRKEKVASGVRLLSPDHFGQSLHGPQIPFFLAVFRDSGSAPRYSGSTDEATYSLTLACIFFTRSGKVSLKSIRSSGSAVKL